MVGGEKEKNAIACVCTHEILIYCAVRKINPQRVLSLPSAGTACRAPGVGLWGVLGFGPLRLVLWGVWLHLWRKERSASLLFSKEWETSLPLDRPRLEAIRAEVWAWLIVRVQGLKFCLKLEGVAKPSGFERWKTGEAFRRASTAVFCRVA